MWMVEGFVSIQNEGDGEETIEEVAERYLNELVGRCMIQVGKESSSGRIKTCRMHDLMRDMCLSKAKEENFIQSEIENNTIKVGCRVLRVRRIYQLRSLILHSYHTSMLSGNLPLLSMVTNIKLLRMLVVEGIDISETKLSKEIGNLIHLKYLSLRDSEVSYFPSMKKLRCLETLDLLVRFSGSGWGLLFGGGLNGNAIWKMENLRHLYLPDSSYNYRRRSKKVEIDYWKSFVKVQSLVNFPPPNVEVSEVVKFPNVRKLGIIVESKEAQKVVEFSETLERKKVKFSRLSSLSLALNYEKSSTECENVVDLEGILIGCPNLYKLSIQGLLVNIPPEVNQLATKLTKLILEGSDIEDPKQIETNLGNLPNLKILHLEGNAFRGRELCFQGGSFPQLKSLRLDRLPNLEEWRVDQGAMPILQSLHINECKKLKMVPEGLKFIDMLKELCISGMPNIQD